MKHSIYHFSLVAVIVVTCAQCGCAVRHDRNLRERSWPNGSVRHVSFELQVTGVESTNSEIRLLTSGVVNEVPVSAEFRFDLSVLRPVTRDYTLERFSAGGKIRWIDERSRNLDALVANVFPENQGNSLFDDGYNAGFLTTPQLWLSKGGEVAMGEPFSNPRGWGITLKYSPRSKSIRVKVYLCS